VVAAVDVVAVMVAAVEQIAFLQQVEWETVGSLLCTVES